MKKISTRYLTLALMLPMMAYGGTAQAAFTLMEGKMVGDLAVNVGVQQKDVNGSDEKFEEYRDVEEGFVLNDLRLKLESTTTPCYLDLKIKDAMQDDESYRLVVGQHGRVKFTFDYDSTPHNFGSGSFLWGGFGDDRLQIADVVQSQLQANEQTRQERGSLANVDTTGEDAIQQGIVQGLYAGAESEDFSITRETTGASLEINLSEDVKAWLRVKNENRDGARVISAGTYERYPQGASGLTHTEDQFVASGAELAEPIDYQTLMLTVGAGVYKKNWLLDAEYTFTDFDNGDEELLWDNPFRLIDAAAQSATGTPNNAFDRGRFEVGQLALTPDSQSHDITVSGAVDLPLHSKFTGSVSYGIITQDQDFVPYTQNSAVSSIPVASGGPGFDVTDVANLPQGDLDGEVETVALNLGISSRPIDQVTVNAKYRYYDYNNKSDEILFPGYSAFGESYWRKFKNDVPDPDAPVENEVSDYTRQNLDLGVDFRIAKPVTLSVEGGWEGWSFDNARLDGMDEYSIGAGVIFRPSRTAQLKLAYKYSDRTVDDYLQGATAENPEARGLINYNWAERERQEATARFQIIPIETVTLGLLGSWNDEDYDGDTEGSNSTLDDFRFGRTDVESWLGGVDVTYAPSEQFSFYANYSYENREEKMANGAKDDSFNSPSTIDDAFTGDNFNPLNYWDSDIEEDVNTVGIGATVQLIPNKLVLDANYIYSKSDAEYDTSNPNGAAKLTNAVAQEWDNVKSELHEVKVNLAYYFTTNLKVGLLYLYERYDLDDFAWDDMQSYMAGQSVENTTKFVFTDGNYDDYDAHMGGIYVSCRF